MFKALLNYYKKPRSIQWYVSAPIPIFAILTLVLVTTVAPRVIENLVKENAVETAVDLSKTLQKIRNYYAEHVLTDIDKDSNIEVTHLHQLSSNSIPIPATFLIEMAQSYSEQDTLRVAVTSPYPFEPRKERVMDQFQQQAWQQLNQNPEQPVSQFAQINDRQVVKVALPDTLTSQNCVNCHNSHSDSGKKDWKLGDVRGIVEITVDVEQSLSRANNASIAMILVSFISLLLVILFNLRLAKKISTPLASITSAMSALSERKFVTTTEKHHGYLEVKALSKAFVNFQDNERKRQALEDEVHQLAYFDSLTQLPNRAAMVKQLSEQIRQLTSRESIKLVLLNIEKFNEVNDILGYGIGEQALREVAKRLQSVCEFCYLAKFNTTEFAICWQSDQEDSGQSLVERCLMTIHEPIFVDEHQINLCLNAGIYQITDTDLSPNEALSLANIALHHAELDQQEKIVLYTPSLSENFNQQVTMIKALKSAIEQDQLVPYFQPQVDLATGQLIGAEVLLRWIKPNGSLVSPIEFIPLAEKSRLIIPIGELVLNKACQFNKQWQQQGLKPIRIAVNVSGVQFAEDDMVNSVKRAIQDSGLNPKWLELEVTETALMADINDIINKLNQLRQLGVELAIDDFGTGYSSLNYLKQLPIDRLKIDQSFVRNIITNEDDQAIVNMILGLGRSMKLKVIAEGIEGEAEQQLLAELGCDEGQGYYYAKPMPAEDFERFLGRFSETT